MKEEQTVRELHSERKKMWDASMRNHLKYIDTTTNRFAEPFVEKRNCPVCSDNDLSVHIFQKSGGDYHICKKCDSIFLNPAFKDKYLNEYYSSNHDVQSAIVENDSEFYTSLYNKGLSNIRAVLNRTGRLLDIGCSSGVFLDLAKKDGWATVGIELNRKEAEYCRRKGHTVLSEPLSQPQISEELGQVDVVTLWDVFEHIKDGCALLEQAKRNLAPDGIVFIQSPTSDALAAKVMRERCNMFDGLEHVNIYSQKGVRILAQHCGYRIADYTTVISEVGVLNNYLQYDDPYLGSTTDRHTLLGHIESDRILKANLGYKFQVVLQRK